MFIKARCVLIVAIDLPTSLIQRAQSTTDHLKIKPIPFALLTTYMEMLSQATPVQITVFELKIPSSIRSRSSIIFWSVYYLVEKSKRMDSTLVYAVVFGCLILCEIADKAVDLVVTIRYKDGRIFNHPQDSVYYALITFLVSGFLITSSRIILYLKRIKLWPGDDDDENIATIDLWISLSKALFEAFPQTTTVQFYFGNCAQTGNAKTLVQAFPQTTIALFYFGNCAQAGNIETLVEAFDVFSIIPFVTLVCHSFYYCCGTEEPNGLTLLIAALAVIVSVIGFVFACISISDFNEHC